MMDSGMKEKILEKLLELFSNLPDKDDGMLKEGAPKEGGEVSMIGVGANPLDDKKEVL